MTKISVARHAALLIMLGVVLAFARAYFTAMFFYPDREDLGSPEFRGARYEGVTFPSLDGKRRLAGFFLTAAAPAKGTVVHCHGNAGNVTAHYPLMMFLVDAGYNVLAFDYAGFGWSEGKPSPDGIVDDTLAALAYVRGRPDVDANRLVLFGQSLGGCAAAAAMARDPGVSALILEGAFSTYRAMAFETGLGRMLFFITPFVIPNTGPLQDLPAVAPRPVLILHGEADDVVPAKFARVLYEAAKEPKSLVLLKGFRHLEGAEASPEYRERILDFLSRLPS